MGGIIVATVKQILDIVDDIAPFALAEAWDNVGVLCGRADMEVKRVLCALDMSEHVIDEALDKGANLIVTHHPILFSGRKNLSEDDAEGRMLCKLVRARIAHIAAHTNYDLAAGGVNDCLARALKLKNVNAIEHDAQALVRIGDIDETTLGDFAQFAQTALGDVVRVCGDKRKLIKRVAVCSGSGGEYAHIALNARADVYLTGEMRYHDQLNMCAEGLATLTCGHAATERIAINPLAEGLQTRINALQYNTQVLVSDMGVI